MTAFTDPLSIALSAAGTSNFQGAMPTLYNSQLGTPVYSDLNISAGSYSVDGATVNYNAINLPDALFVVRKRKRVIVTSINGATSDVLEYTGSESAQISCTVKIYGSNLNYPLNDMDNFYLMLESNQPIQINSWYLNQVEIYYAVITDYELPQQTGNISDQQIKFNMRHIDVTQYPTLLNG
jgi:hypothetical protein